MITAKQLPSKYWHIRGRGPCNWAQPPRWPCTESMLRAHAFPQASEQFFREAMLSGRVVTEVSCLGELGGR